MGAFDGKGGAEPTPREKVRKQGREGARDEDYTGMPEEEGKTGQPVLGKHGMGGKQTEKKLTSRSADRRP